jgi:hypothetical protein
MIDIVNAMVNKMILLLLLFNLSEINDHVSGLTSEAWERILFWSLVAIVNVLSKVITNFHVTKFID